MQLACRSHSMKHLGMLQPWGYWRSKRSSLILLLIAAAIWGLIKLRNWIRNPVTPVHPALLVVEEADKGTRTLVDYVSGEGEGTACNSFESRESFPWVLCYVAHKKDLRWRMNHCIVKPSVLCGICTFFVAAVGSTQ